jgi:hypothetical protein
MWRFRGLSRAVVEADLRRSLWRRNREKPAGDDTVARTKTDTGRRGEYPKALERTAVKELGNLTP